MSNKPAKKANQMTRGVIKTVAGIAVSSPKDFVRLAAHAGDSFLKKEFSQAVSDTYTFFVNKGEIDPKYFDSTNFADLAPEFKKAHEGDFGVEKLNQLRKIFVNIARDNGSDSHTKHLLDIALDMSEIEMKVLVADYKFIPEVRSDPEYRQQMSTSGWSSRIAEISGLKHTSLVMTASDALVNRKLFTDYIHSDHSAIRSRTNESRLTSMGMELCNLMNLEEDPYTQEQ